MRTSWMLRMVVVLALPAANTGCLTSMIAREIGRGCAKVPSPPRPTAIDAVLGCSVARIASGSYAPNLLVRLDDGSERVFLSDGGALGAAPPGAKLPLSDLSVVVTTGAACRVKLGSPVRHVRADGRIDDEPAPLMAGEALLSAVLELAPPGPHEGAWRVALHVPPERGRRLREGDLLPQGEAPLSLTMRGPLVDTAPTREWIRILVLATVLPFTFAIDAAMFFAAHPFGGGDQGYWACVKNMGTGPLLPGGTDDCGKSSQTAPARSPTGAPPPKSSPSR